MRKQLAIDLSPWTVAIMACAFYQNNRLFNLIFLVLITVLVMFSYKRINKKYNLAIFNCFTLLTAYCFYALGLFPKTPHELLTSSLLFFTGGITVSLAISRPFIADYRKLRLRENRTKTRFFRFTNTLYSFYLLAGIAAATTVSLSQTLIAFWFAIITAIFSIGAFVWFSTKVIASTAWLWNYLLPKNPYTNIPNHTQFITKSGEQATIREAKLEDKNSIITGLLNVDDDSVQLFEKTGRNLRDCLEYNLSKKTSTDWYRNIDVVEIEKKVAAVVQVTSSYFTKLHHKKTYIGNSLDSKIVENYLNSQNNMLFPQSLYIEKIYTKNSLRRIGIASNMLTRVIERAKRYGFKTVSLHVKESNATALSLYQKLGFKIVDKLLMPDEVSKESPATYYMVKNIDTEA